MVQTELQRIDHNQESFRKTLIREGERKRMLLEKVHQLEQMIQNQNSERSAPFASAVRTPFPCEPPSSRRYAGRPGSRAATSTPQGTASVTGNLQCHDDERPASCRTTREERVQSPSRSGRSPMRTSVGGRFALGCGTWRLGGGGLSVGVRGTVACMLCMAMARVEEGAGWGIGRLQGQPGRQWVGAPACRRRKC